MQDFCIFSLFQYFHSTVWILLPPQFACNTTCFHNSFYVNHFIFCFIARFEWPLSVLLFQNKFSWIVIKCRETHNVIMPVCLSACLAAAAGNQRSATCYRKCVGFLFSGFTASSLPIIVHPPEYYLFEFTSKLFLIFSCIINRNPQCRSRLCSWNWTFRIECALLSSSEGKHWQVYKTSQVYLFLHTYNLDLIQKK